MTRRRQKDESRRMMPEEKENYQCQHDEPANRFSAFQMNTDGKTTQPKPPYPDAQCSKQRWERTGQTGGVNLGNGWKYRMREKTPILGQTTMQTADAKVACMSMAAHGIHGAAN